MKFQTWLFIALSLFVVLNAVLLKTKVSRHEYILAFLLGAGYLFYLAYIPLTYAEDRSTLYKILEQKISLVLLPFIMLLLSKLNHVDYKKTLYLFPIGAALLSVFTHCYMLLHTNSSTWSDHVSYRIAFESISGIHPSYFGLFIAFGLAITWFENQTTSFRKYTRIIVQIILLLTLLSLAPKSAILSLILISFLQFFIFDTRHLRIKILYIGTTLLGCIILYFIIPFFHQRIDEVVAFATGNKHNLINNSMDMRNLLFNIDLGLLKQHWMLGIGPIQLQKELNLLLHLSTVYTGQIVPSYNTHNEYLNQWLCFGLAGFIYFISLIGIHIRISISSQNYLYLFLMLILSVNFLTENVLSRQHGILFFALFSSLFFFSTRKN